MKWWRHWRTKPTETAPESHWQRAKAGHQTLIEAVPRLQPLQRVLTDTTIALFSHHKFYDPLLERRVYGREGMVRLLEYSGGAILALEHRLYAGALTQALALFEQVVDLHAVLSRPGTAQVEALLHNALVHAPSHLRAWKAYGQSCPPAVGEAADQRQRRMQLLTVGLDVSDARPWLPLRDRVRGTVFEAPYYTLFAQGRNATEQLDEQLGNSILHLTGAVITGIDSDEIDEALEAERASHTVYVTVFALWCYAVWLAPWLEHVNAPTADLVRLSEAAKVLGEMIDVCERTYAEFIGVPAPPPLRTSA